MAEVKCLKCKSTTENSYAIQCCKCSRWWHTKCVHMTKAVLNSYEKELKNPEGKRWFCQPCEPKGDIIRRPSIGTAGSCTKKEYNLNDVMEKLQEMDSKYTNLMEKFREQADINESLKTWIKQLEAKIQKLERSESGSNITSKNATEAADEIEEREYRKKNLVVFGVTELESEEAEERKTHDMQLVKSIFEGSCPQVLKEGVKVVRIGKRENGKIRPVKVIMRSEEDVRKVFGRVKDIKKNPLFARIVFSNDRTKQQLEQYKALREELRDRLQNGEENLKIHYANGVPKIVSTKN